MTLALWCLLVAALLPIACAGIAKWGFQGFDNNNPREWLARQQGSARDRGEVRGRERAGNVARLEERRARAINDVDRFEGFHLNRSMTLCVFRGA